MLIFNCPVRTTSDIIDGKWKPLIIQSLKNGPMRFGDLRRNVPEPAAKVLTAQLRELEKDRIVQRKILAGKPLGVRYSLTRYGKTLVPVLARMAIWGKKHQRLTREAPADL